ARRARHGGGRARRDPRRRRGRARPDRGRRAGGPVPERDLPPGVCGLVSASASDTHVIDIAMPRLSDSMEEATILTWLKRPGDAVARGEPLVEVETDKATMVYESETAGVLEEIVVDDGSTADLGAVIARIRVGGAAAAPPTPAPAPAAEPASPSAATPRVEVEFRDAIRQALDEELARDERVFLFGEDVAV